MTIIQKGERMSDLISRQAVQEIVDRIGGMYPYRQIGNRDSYSQYNEAWTDAINRVDAELNSLPSAQPKIKCIANVTLTDEQVKEAFEKAKCEILAAQPDHIRCRDCKYAEFKPGATIHCKELGADLYQWDYCSYAERRTDESND